MYSGEMGEMKTVGYETIRNFLALDVSDYFAYTNHPENGDIFINTVVSEIEKAANESEFEFLDIESHGNMGFRMRNLILHSKDIECKEPEGIDDLGRRLIVSLCTCGDPKQWGWIALQDSKGNNIKTFRDQKTAEELMDDEDD